ncbi:hypothetical protein GCM10010488_27630 [Oerskovia jenensis]
MVAVRLAPRTEVEDAERVARGDDHVALVPRGVEAREAVDGQVGDLFEARAVEDDDAPVVGQGDARGVGRGLGPVAALLVLVVLVVVLGGVGGGRAGLARGAAGEDDGGQGEGDPQGEAAVSGAGHGVTGPGRVPPSFR